MPKAYSGDHSLEASHFIHIPLVPTIDSLIISSHHFLTSAVNPFTVAYGQTIKMTAFG